jgi:hypothetical protein
VILYMLLTVYWSIVKRPFGSNPAQTASPVEPSTFVYLWVALSSEHFKLQRSHVSVLPASMSHTPCFRGFISAILNSWLRHCQRGCIHLPNNLLLHDSDFWIMYDRWGGKFGSLNLRVNHYYWEKGKEGRTGKGTEKEWWKKSYSRPYCLGATLQPTPTSHCFIVVVLGAHLGVEKTTGSTKCSPWRSWGLLVDASPAFKSFWPL